MYCLGFCFLEMFGVMMMNVWSDDDTSLKSNPPGPGLSSNFWLRKAVCNRIRCAGIAATSVLLAIILTYIAGTRIYRVV